MHEEIEAFVEGMQGPPRLREACAYALRSGGKRLRPLLVHLIAHEMDPRARVAESALAVELFHTASLIADDLPCMDDEVQRRGKESVHRKYGEATALLASYALIAEGYNCVQKNAEGHSLEVCRLAIASVSKNTGMLGATGGQYFDLFAPQEHLEQMIAMKTGALFELSFVLGWLFGGGDPQRVASVQVAAQHFGMAFQIQDDIDDLSRDRPECNYAACFGVAEAQRRIAEELQSFHLCATSLALPDLMPLLTRVLVV